MFFVISGYLISGIIFRDGERSGFLAHFYGSRVRRIFPALCVVLFATLAMGWAVLLPDEFRLLGKHIFAGSAFVSNFALAREADYFDVAADLKPLLHLWSLGIEEQFYFVWPALVILAVRWRWNVSAVIAAVLIVSLAIDIAFVGSHPIRVFYWPVTRFWELLAGATLAWAEFKRSRPLIEGAKASGLSMFGLALVCLGVFYYDRSMSYPGWRALAPVLGASMMIAAGPTALVNRHILSLRPMIFVGLISYPLYLWHWPLFSFARIMESGDPDPVFIPIATVLSVVLAWLTYQFVEKPIRRRPVALPNALKLSGALGVIACSGLFVFLHGAPPTPLGPAYVSSVSNTGPWWDGVKRSCEGVIATTTSNDFCIVSKHQDANAPVDLVIGDSHSYAFGQGLAVTGLGAQNLVLVSRAGCPPFLSVERYESGRRRACDFDQIINKFAGRKIRNLVLIARYSFYATGDGYRADGGLQPGIVAIQSKDHSEGDYPSILAEGLARTLNEVKAQKITILLQAPELGFDIKSCQDTRPVRLRSHVRTPCAIPRSDVEERQNSYKPLFLKVLNGFPNVNVIDPMDSLCDSKWCYGMIGSQVLYVDDNHVSSIGATKVLSSFPH